MANALMVGSLLNFLPTSIKTHIGRIEQAVAGWPIEVNIDHAVRWILQFDVDDYPLALRIIENLDVVGTVQIRYALEIAHSKLLRRIAEKGSSIANGNTLYAAVGNAAKSGSLISYHYRVAAQIAEGDFFSSGEKSALDFTHIDNIVLVDDVIGTGDTVARDVNEVADIINKLKRPRKIFVLTVAGYEDGVQRLMEQSGASVVTALEYGTDDTVSNLDATFYAGLSTRERVETLERIKHYCRNVSRSELGYGGIGGLLVFDHNTPNTTLPLLWSSERGWLPLFPRATKIPGAARVVKSAQEELKTADGEVETPREQAELTLFVEGKTDELFADVLRQRHDLARRIGVAKVQVVALGGLHQSVKLLDLLKTTKKDAVFVLEDDAPTQRVLRNHPDLERERIVFLRPSFIAMLDIPRIYENRSRFPSLPEPLPSALPEQTAKDASDRWLHQVEVAVLRQRANIGRAAQLIDEFLVPSKYKAFVDDLRAAANVVFFGR